MKKNRFRFSLLGLAAVATLIALFYAWTDWAGARHWKAVEAELRAKGEPLTIAEIEPKPIPDELNFAAAPIFAEIFQSPGGKWRISSLQPLNGSIFPGSAKLGIASVTLDGKQSGSRTEAAKLILAQTDVKWRSVLDEVREAAKRPGTVWPLTYSDGFRIKIPYLQPLLAIGDVLSFEAKAHLQLGSATSAFSDFQLILNLADRVRDPALVINHLLRRAMIQLDLDVIHFGIDRHEWNAAALETMQKQLAEISVLSDLARALRSERVFFCDGAWSWGTGGRKITALYEFRGYPGWSFDPQWTDFINEMVWKLHPKGWMNEDRSAYSKTMQPIITWLSRFPWAGNFPDSDATLGKLTNTPFAKLCAPRSSVMLPTLSDLAVNAIHDQAKIDEALIACAIERYRLAHDSLPSTLEILQPQFLLKLPRDPVDGEPFHYRVTGTGSYILYSVGRNKRDDGGDGIDHRSSAPHSARENPLNAPDWVWKIDPQP